MEEIQIQPPVPKTPKERARAFVNSATFAAITLGTITTTAKLADYPSGASDWPWWAALTPVWAGPACLLLILAAAVVGMGVMWVVLALLTAWDHAMVSYYDWRNARATKRIQERYIKLARIIEAANERAKE